MTADTNWLEEQLLETPLRVRTEELKMLALAQEIDGLENKQKAIRLRTYAMVCAAKNSELKPEYSNDKLREAATEERLSADFDYQALVNQELEVRQLLKTSTIERDYAERSFKAAQYAIRLLTVLKEDSE